jgi:hypothetical protein
MQQRRSAWPARAAALVALLFSLSAGGLSHDSARSLPSTTTHPSAVLAETLAATELVSDQTPRVELTETRTRLHPAGPTTGSPAIVLTARPDWLVETDAATASDPSYADAPGTHRDRAPPHLI